MISGHSLTETACMHIRAITAIVMLFALVLQQGCSTYRTTGAGNSPRATGHAFTIPEIDRTQDHLIAWVPLARAQTPAVAEALVHVELANAKELVGSKLCDGAWPVDGEVTARYGPVPATAPQDLGGYAAWYYRISQRPGLKGCGGSSASELYRKLRASLPQWILLQTAASSQPQDDPPAATVSLVK
jgi:hypothetical protein